MRIAYLCLEKGIRQIEIRFWRGKMTKKRYYRFCSDYMNLLEQKEFNDTYFDVKKFERIKKKLVEELKYSQRILEYYILDAYVGHRKIPESDLFYWEKIRYLYTMVTLEKTISESDYQGTYRKVSSWCGLGMMELIGVLFVGIALIIYILYSWWRIENGG